MAHPDSDKLECDDSTANSPEGSSSRGSGKNRRRVGYIAAGLAGLGLVAGAAYVGQHPEVLPFIEKPKVEAAPPAGPSIEERLITLLTSFGTTLNRVATHTENTAVNTRSLGWDGNINHDAQLLAEEAAFARQEAETIRRKSIIESVVHRVLGSDDQTLMFRTFLIDLLSSITASSPTETHLSADNYAGRKKENIYSPLSSLLLSLGVRNRLPYDLYEKESPFPSYIHDEGYSQSGKKTLLDNLNGKNEAEIDTLLAQLFSIIDLLPDHMRATASLLLLNQSKELEVVLPHFKRFERILPHHEEVRGKDRTADTKCNDAWYKLHEQYNNDEYWTSKGLSAPTARFLCRRLMELRKIGISPETIHSLITKIIAKLGHLLPDKK